MDRNYCMVAWNKRIVRKKFNKLFRKKKKGFAKLWGWGITFLQKKLHKISVAAYIMKQSIK